MNENDYINCSGYKVLQYFPPDSVSIDLPFILTKSKMLTRKMPYMLLEKKVSGNHTTAIRLLDFHEHDNIIYLKVQELSSSKILTISWNTDNHGDFWLWTLADYQTLISLM